MSFLPQTIHIESGAEDYALTHAVLARFPSVPVEREVDAKTLTEKLRRTEADVFGAGKRHLLLSRFKGSFLKKCPGISKGMVCCNYLVVNLIKNCVYDCSYCFLQDFLDNNPVLCAFVNVENLFDELEATFSAQPTSHFRVGTGELTDSLALDDVLPYAQRLAPFFARHANATLELKTKSDNVANLLRCEGAANVIVSWSINPPEVIAREEKGTPSLERRLDAAQRCKNHGFRIGFHLDPVILYPGWEEGYARLIDSLFERVNPDDIESISLGGFRYRPHLKQVIRERHTDSLLFTQEHVVCEDGKFRYLRPLRNHAFDTLRRLIKQRSERLGVFLCMETKEIWEGVTGALPRKDETLEPFFGS